MLESKTKYFTERLETEQQNVESLGSVIKAKETEVEDAQKKSNELQVGLHFHKSSLFTGIKVRKGKDKYELRIFSEFCSRIGM